MDYRILHDNGFDVEFGLECTGSDDNYLHLIQRYYKNAAKTEDSLSAFLVERKLEDYTRTVHSLKSTSKMIGALEFAQLAEEMEMLGRHGDYSGLLLKTPDLLDAFEAVVEVIKPYGEMPEVHPDGEISGAEAKKLAEELLVLLDDCNDAKALKCAEKLLGYPFRTTQKNLLKDAMVYISDFDYDKAADNIELIMKEIEE